MLLTLLAKNMFKKYLKSFTPFGGSDFLMEEIDEFLEHDDSIPPGVDGIYDSELVILRLSPTISLNRLTESILLTSLVKNMFKKYLKFLKMAIPFLLQYVQLSLPSKLVILRLSPTISLNRLTESMLLTLLAKNMFKKYLKFLKVAILPGVDGIYDSEGDTVYLEELLSIINSDPNLPPLPVCEINVPEEIKSSCEDPPDLELKDLPSYLEYAFLEGDDKLPVIIAKNLKDED
ncbi:hypothetical protein Tco_1247908 [Tanacetum coccineum]